MNTSNHKYLATWLYTDSYIQKVLAQNSIYSSEKTQVGKIQLVGGEGISLNQLDDKAFRGHLIRVENPARLSLADVTKPEGELLEDIVKSRAAFDVDVNNEEYSSENGVLFNKDKTLLMEYPSGKKDSSYTIPDSVANILGSTFSGCTSLESVTIPSSVTRIGWYAFEGCTALENIIIPSSVTEIGGSAFEGCTALKSITIPSSVRDIGYYAFDGCSSLAEIKVNVDNESYSSESGVLFNKDKTELIQYPLGKKDSSYTILDSVTYVGYSLSDCAALAEINVSDGNESYSSEDGVLFNKDKTELIRYPAGKQDSSYAIPDSVTEIYNGAFRNCSSLTSIAIPSGVTSIGGSAFYGCTALTAFDVDVNNEEYSSIDGVIFDKGKTSLLIYPTGRKDSSYSIPNGVRYIGSYEFYSFAHNTHLTSVVIPKSVTTIYSPVFNSYEDITIHGYENFTAHQYANDYDIPFVAIGQEHEHSFGLWIVETPATVDAEGREYRVCSCGIKEYRAIPKLTGREIVISPNEQLDVFKSEIIAQGIYLYEGFNAAQILDLTQKEGISLKDKDGNELVGDAAVGSGSTINLIQNGEVLDSYTFILIGDANGDGKITAVDARLALRASARLEKDFADWQTLASDANNEGGVTAADARAILRVSARLDSFKK